ncbi:MAG: hypothetical protein ACRDIB_01935, partial [Ardenticatenaceae bacterium]
MSVRAMVARDVVIVVESGARPYRNALLADVAVRRANKLGALHKLLHGFIESAEKHHPPKHTHEQLFVVGQGYP